MTQPARAPADPRPWSQYTEALSGGSISTEMAIQEICLCRALAAICPPGNTHCALQDGAVVPDPFLADVRVRVGRDQDLQAWLGWSGKKADRNQAEEALGKAAERLPPVLIAWRTLRRVFRTDPLTGTGSRHALDECLTGQLDLAERHQVPFSVIMLDADSFKTINDNQGHAAGDQALTRLTHWLRQSVRGHDQLFRYGGDEFVLLLSHLDEQGARAVAARIREGAPIPISTGTATAIDGDTPASLLERADHALLKKKAAR